VQDFVTVLMNAYINTRAVLHITTRELLANCPRTTRERPRKPRSYQALKKGSASFCVGRFCLPDGHQSRDSRRHSPQSPQRAQSCRGFCSVTSVGSVVKAVLHSAQRRSTHTKRRRAEKRLCGVSCGSLARRIDRQFEVIPILHQTSTNEDGQPLPQRHRGHGDNTEKNPFGLSLCYLRGLCASVVNAFGSPFQQMTDG